MQRPFDTNASFHQSRESVNTAGAAKNLEDWVLSILPPRAGMRLLDLGCGTGKLIFPYAEKILPDGAALGIDISADSVGKLNDQARACGQDHVEAQTGDLDTVVSQLAGKTFDAIVSSYAIYYATDVVSLLKDLPNLLTGGGAVFVCGYGRGSNREMAELVQRVAGPEVDCPPPLPDFLTQEQIDQVAAAYASAETFRLPNQITFTTPENLLGWWRNHNSYVPDADQAAEAAVREHFNARGNFVLTKNVLGVLLRKQHES